MLRKTELRRTYRARRDAIPLHEREAASDRIRGRVLDLPELAAARRVFVYVSAGSEVQTYTLIEALLAAGKTVAVPRITNLDAGQMEAVPIKSLKELVPSPGPAGTFGLLEPQGGQALEVAPDLTIVPGLAFSPITGVRLGVGGGFYDRYLTANPDTLPVGLAFNAQLRDTLPAEAHDARLSMIITESHGISIDL
ncbi:MAG: 5-formyltetrahydrofolate cyclo-ligase [Planctomycetota bacterium]